MNTDETLPTLVLRAMLSLRTKGLGPTARQTLATTRDITGRWWRRRAASWEGELEARRRRAAESPPTSAGKTRLRRTPFLTVAPGRLVDDQDPRSSPVVLFLVLGRDNTALAALVEQVATLEYAQRDFRPLFLTDSTALHLFRRHDYAVEHLPSARAWGGSDDPTSDEAWLPFVTRRLESIVETYGPSTFIVYDDLPISRAPAGLILARLLADLV